MNNKNLKGIQKHNMENAKLTLLAVLLPFQSTPENIDHP